MADIINESERIRKAIKSIVKEVVKEEEKACFRVYKAKITTPPNGSTCGVKLIGDDTELTLPYSSGCVSVQKDSTVWVATLYDSFSNAFVWQSNNFNSMLSPYPVGAIYLSTNSTSPAELFGGKWNRIEDRFLLTQGSSYTAGSKGGSANAVLVNHDGHLYGYAKWNEANVGTVGKFLNSSQMSTYGSAGRGWWVAYGNEVYPAGHSSGEDGTGKNMPPYLVVHCWERIE